MRILQRIRPRRVGCGIAIRGGDLAAVAIEVRPGGARVLGYTELRAFRNRPPPEWGREYLAFARDLGVGHVAATLCLPREEAVFRTLRLPPMRTRELAKAVALQVEDLHPYGARAVYFDSAPLSDELPAAGQRCVAIAVAEADRIESYTRLFSEAGVKLAACTVSAGAVRASIRMQGQRPRRPFAMAIRAGQSLEIYGESDETPLLSSALDLGGMTLQGALRLVHDGLRPRQGELVSLAVLGGAVETVPGFNPLAADEILGTAADLPDGMSIARDATALGAATESARPGMGLGLNLLPRSARRSHSLAPHAPRLALAAALVLLGGSLVSLPRIQDSRYAERLRDETTRLEGEVSGEGVGAERLAELRRRYRWLLDRQLRVREDLDLLREFSRILPAPTVLSALQLDDSKSVLTGKAGRADPLLAVLEASPLLEEARFTRSPAIGGGGELFQIEARRR